MPRLVILIVLFGSVEALYVPAALGEKKEGMPAKDRFEVRQIRVGKQFQLIRWKVRTGEAWRVAGDKFEKLPESGPVPEGDYEILLVATDDDWMAFRIDRVSGMTWMLRGLQWIRVKEPDEDKKA